MRVASYRCHDIVLQLVVLDDEVGHLNRVLADLSFVSAAADEVPDLLVSVRLSDVTVDAPSQAREVFGIDGLRGLSGDGYFYLTEGSSILRMQPAQGVGQAELAAPFFGRSLDLQQWFWAFGLLKLLRSRGVYGLHAAGVVAPAGPGVLIVGRSGSGKSTLAVGLIQAGWSYLSDDAVLLQRATRGVEALALRRPFSIDPARVSTDPARADEARRNGGRPKRRFDAHAAYPHLAIARAHPDLLVFPRIVAAQRSALRPLARAAALGRLLDQSGVQLFDRSTMPDHLSVLAQLLDQTSAYELQAGQDLDRHPAGLAELLAEVG